MTAFSYDKGINKMERIELLAPAGDYSCFLAGINAGADAIYLSGEKFGARAYAKNFTKDELIMAIDYAHIFSKKVFLTVNTLFKDNEMEELYEYILPYYVAGLDGVIVQDLGVISYLLKAFPDMPVHASTQLAITGLEGIRLLEKEGIKRVVLAREVSLDEINYIHENSSMELETFVHGALCYSYSGKCLFSSLVGGRSGNRGRCAGSCRQPYNDKYLLSTKDICCLSILPDLINSGICSLKIEGRMKSPEYVAGVTSIYRKYIDLYYSYIEKHNLKNEKLTDLDIKNIKSKIFSGTDFELDNNNLISLYTRGGNSSGYYYNHNGKNMITIADASYKSDKGEVKNQIAKDYINSSKKIGIEGYIRIHSNENISLLINNEVYYEGALCDVADNRPLTKETVEKQLTKTKDTEFEFTSIEYDISDNAFVRVSDLNELRRGALELYKSVLLNKYKRSINQRSKINYKKIDDYNNSIDNPLIACEISTIEQLRTVLKIDGIDRIYVPYKVFLSHIEDILASKKEKEVYIKFQSVIRYNFLEKNKSKIISILDKTDGVLADSHEVISFLNSVSYSKPVIGDVHIYGLNNEAVRKYRELNISTLTTPVELNKKELYRRGITGEELIVYGYLPMMVSAQCVNNTLNGCDRKHKEIALSDRKGAVFTAVNNCEECENIIYNSVPIALDTEIDFIRKISPASLRIIFTLEDGESTKKIATYFTKFLVEGNNKSIFKENTYTKGHLNRGVL